MKAEGGFWRDAKTQREGEKKKKKNQNPVDFETVAVGSKKSPGMKQERKPPQETPKKIYIYSGMICNEVKSAKKASNAGPFLGTENLPKKKGGGM